MSERPGMSKQPSLMQRMFGGGSKTKSGGSSGSGSSGINSGNPSSSPAKSTGDRPIDESR